MNWETTSARAGDVEEAAIEAALGVREDPQVGDALGESKDSARIVIATNAEEHDEADADRADDAPSTRTEARVVRWTRAFTGGECMSAALPGDLLVFRPALRTDGNQNL